MRKSSSVAVFARMAIVLALGCSAASTWAVDYTVERRFDALPGWRNYYLTSLPDDIGLSDVANSTATWADKCNIAGIGGDGVLNVDDFICTVWGTGTPASRQGKIDVMHLDSASCTFSLRRAEMVPALGVVFQGMSFPISGSMSLVVDVDGPSRNTIFAENVGTLRGTCQADFPTQALPFDTCKRFVLAVPDDAVPLTADELLCGKQGVDWQDLVNNATGFGSPDGKPDTCPAGIFGNGNLPWATVSVFDNDPNDPWTLSDNQYRSRRITPLFGRLNFDGYDSTLQPGSAVLVNTGQGAHPTAYDIPVDDTLCP